MQPVYKIFYVVNPRILFIFSPSPNSTDRNLVGSITVVRADTQDELREVIKSSRAPWGIPWTGEGTAAATAEAPDLAH